jgi:signal transduction histidine kinase
MVGDLLDSAQIEAGQLALKLGDHDLRTIVGEAAELFGKASDSHTLQVCLSETQVIVRCDATRIEQALINLLSNAIKYSPAGGAVRVSLRIERERAVVEIADRGMGIATDDLERLWQPFQRDRWAREQVPGAGLGLSIVRRIATAHGGEVGVWSEPGVGSTFSVWLPLADTRSCSAPAP